MKYFLFGLIIVCNFVWAGEEKVKETLSQIKGCFEVQYQFIEDGDHDKTYAPIYEWIRQKPHDSEIILEHIGQYPLYNEDGTRKVDENGEPLYLAQYHWREHWVPISGAQWKTWTYGPYKDSPVRYECEGSWVMGQFHCHTDALKPRRHSSRNYDYLARVNNLQVNKNQWVHAQRNKLMLKDGTVVATEMGWNTYKRVEEKLCLPAINSHAEPL